MELYLLGIEILLITLSFYLMRNLNIIFPIVVSFIIFLIFNINFDKNTSSFGNRIITNIKNCCKKLKR